jgi:hypothetical protein
LRLRARAERMPFTVTRPLWRIRERALWDVVFLHGALDRFGGVRALSRGRELPQARGWLSVTALVWHRKADYYVSRAEECARAAGVAKTPAFGTV